MTRVNVDCTMSGFILNIVNGYKKGADRMLIHNLMWKLKKLLRSNGKKEDVTKVIRKEVKKYPLTKNHRTTLFSKLDKLN